MAASAYTTMPHQASLRISTTFEDANLAVTLHLPQLRGQHDFRRL
jgi:hypothetical protein